MKYRKYTLENCEAATDAVVVIDVLRAFSTAAYAFAAGAESILLVSSVEEALSLRQSHPGSLVMGEIGGIKVEAFDLGNSPTEILGRDFRGRKLIQRTSAGTQGMVRSRSARTLLAASFCCASATAKYLRKIAPNSVGFVITGAGVDGKGDEDAACADYLKALLRGEKPNFEGYRQRVIDSPTGGIFNDPDHPDFPASDLELCLDLDRFSFAMKAVRENGILTLRPIDPDSI